MAKDDRLRRRSPFRERFPRLLIVCEGEETEFGYFDDQRVRHKVNIEISAKGDPKGLVERAVRMKKEADRAARAAKDKNFQFDSVWCVFDVDAHHRIQDAEQQARTSGINLAISNPCFELWILLHFQDHRRSVGSKALKEIIRKHLPGYDKDVPCGALREHYEKARTRAIQLEAWQAQQGRTGHPNPSTGVYKLTEQIKSFERL